MAKTKKLTKAYPLLLLVIGTIVVGGATAILYWSSAPVEWQHSFTVEGLSGAAIQVSNGADVTAMVANYEGQVEATTLGTGSYLYGTTYDIDDGLIVVYTDGNAPLSNGLVVDLTVDITGSGAESVTYTAVGKYAIVLYNTFASKKIYVESNKPPIIFTDGRATIPNGDVSLMTYDSTLLHFGDDSYLNDGNMLVIEFTFSGGGSESMDWGDYTADIDITVSLGPNT